jgi:hypothetical protein
VNQEFEYGGSDGRWVEYERLIDGEALEIELSHFDQWSGKTDVPTVDESEYRDGNESRLRDRSWKPDGRARG